MSIRRDLPHSRGVATGTVGYHLQQVTTARSETAVDPTSNTPRLDFFRDPDQVDADWAILEATGTCTAFQTRAWLRPFYRDVAPRRGLSPLLLRLSDPVSGAPLMLWPLVRQRRMGLVVVSFADAGVSDFNAPLVAAGIVAAHEAGLWQQALAALRAEGALLCLEKVPANRLSEARALNATLATAAPMSFGSWAVDLPASIAEFQQQRLTPTFVKDLALRRRRLEKKGELRFAVATTEDARRAAFANLARQRGRRFAETGRIDSLAEPVFRHFYEAAAVAEPGDTVRLFTLSVDATTVAVVLALDHARTRCLLMPSFEAGDWKNGSPGNVLMMMCIAQAIDCGFERFDFTIGDESYKAGFGATRQAVWRGLVPLSAAGALVVRIDGLARGLRDRFRDRLRDRLPDRLPAWPRAQPVGAKTMPSAGG